MSDKNQKCDPIRERRFALCHIDEEAVACLAFGEVVGDPSSLPEDWMLLSTHLDPYRRGFIFTIASASFDPVPKHGVIPVLPELDIKLVENPTVAEIMAAQKGPETS